MKDCLDYEHKEEKENLTRAAPATQEGWKWASDLSQ
jgi:hypothetical protein